MDEPREWCARNTELQASEAKAKHTDQGDPEILRYKLLKPKQSVQIRVILKAVQRSTRKSLEMQC